MKSRLQTGTGAQLARPRRRSRERGRRDGDEVVVELGAELIAMAVDAGDDVAR